MPEKKCTEAVRGEVEHVFGDLHLYSGQTADCECGHVTVRGEGRWLTIVTNVFVGND